MELEAQTCYRAVEAKDPRFDGLFFVGVASTGIYCRCVCPAKLPKLENCQFYHSAANAEAKGFRPCLRCRPEIAPGRSSVDALKSHARRAARLIERGALETMSLTELANSLHISDRQLRRVMLNELGVSPLEFAQTYRLLVAKQMLTDTRLPIGEIALASGFKSVRRMNTVFRERYRLAPTDIRGRRGRPKSSSITCQLSFRPPFDWSGHLDFLRSRRIAGVEVIDDTSYSRTVSIEGRKGTVRVTKSLAKNTLIVEVSEALAPVLPKLIERIKRVFDLDANPILINEALGELSCANPGVRLPGAFDGFELAIRAILGQQVSVSFATTLAGRIAEKFGEPIQSDTPGLDYLFPDAERLAALTQDDIASLGVIGSRSRAIIAIAIEVSEGRIHLSPLADYETTRDALVKIPGFGPWTAEYICMRGLCYPDAHPTQDLGIVKALGTKNPREVADRMQAFRPWRAYATMHLWRSL